jgi:tol-pal system protein YbgF
LLRHTWVFASLALASCATTSASSSELDQLRAEVRATREENDRLARRLERLETLSAVRNAARTPPAPSSATPDLMVVKLKPKADAAPKIDTTRTVVEPDRSVLAAPEEEKEDPGVADKVFDSGVDMLKTGNVAGGVDSLLRFASEYPKHPRADNALYFAGVGFLGLEDAADAARTFQQLIDSYPAGDAVIDAMLKLGEARLKLNQPKDAKAIYQKIVTRYPGTPAASQAQARLASL